MARDVQGRVKSSIAADCMACAACRWSRYHPLVAQTELRPASANSRLASRPHRRASARYPRDVAPPVLVEVRRGAIVESRHRGHIVQVDATGQVERGIGDPDVLVNLRSAVKPFALVALVEVGRRRGVPADATRSWP